MPEGVPRHVVLDGLSAGLIETEPETPLASSLGVVECVFASAQAAPTVDHSHSPVVQWEFKRAAIFPDQHFDAGVFAVHLFPFEIQNFFSSVSARKRICRLSACRNFTPLTGFLPKNHCQRSECGSGEKTDSIAGSTIASVRCQTRKGALLGGMLPGPISTIAS